MIYPLIVLYALTKIVSFTLSRIVKTHRAISINNSLVHGICNYSCRLCSINKATYNGPKEYQPFEVTKTLIRRIRESARSGVYIRYITNSGDGEPTLHPEFRSRIGMFGSMLREWDFPGIPSPEVSIVTNGSRLHLPGIEDSFTENTITLIISLPTIKPESYGAIMADDSSRGASMLSVVLPNREKAMMLRAEGYLSKLCFHISPPETEIIRSDFPETVDYLTNIANRNGLEEIELILFPAISNRSGLVRSSVIRVDMYKDLFKHYNDRIFNDVKIRMKLVLKRFFVDAGEIADLIRSFRFPCLWNANFFIAADGNSICCNDQIVRYPNGNIMYDSIDTLMENKEMFMSGSICSGCNQSPHELKGSPEAILYSYIARARSFSAVMYDKMTELKKIFLKSDSTTSKREITCRTDCLSEAAADNCGTENEILSYPMFPDTIDDMKEVFHLIYDNYLASGLQRIDPSLLRIRFHNLLPVSYPMVVKRKGRVSGTLTVIRENCSELPIEKLFGDKIGRIRTEKSLICELSGLALDASMSPVESRDIMMSLFKHAFILSHDILGCTDYCMMINPHHSKYYQKEFGFVQIGEVKLCDSVNGAPAVPMHLCLETVAEEIQKSNPVLFQYFYVSDRRQIKERILSELPKQGKLYCTDYITKLSKSGNSLFDNLSAERKDILSSYYPEMRLR